MKKGITIVLLFVSIWVSATTYYVAPNGNDNYPGSFSQPWGTWGKAFTSTSVKAGDTVLFRGGVYNITVTNGSGYSVTRTGTSDNWIVYMNYPGETPVLECSAATPSGQYNIGVGSSSRAGANYIKFIGLTVRNVLQKRKDAMVWATGFGCDNGNFVFENCVAYNIEGVGFESYFYDGWVNVDGSHYFINCDAYNCSNPEVISGYLPGNNGSGFSSTSFTSTRGSAYAIGCRAWECGDQGFVYSGEHYCETTGCWAFNNGDLQGDGHGFKIGWHSLVYPETGRLNVSLKNCISAYNRYSGITTNDSQGVATGMNVYNNLIYANGHYSQYICGIYIYDTPDNSTNELARIFKNNIALNNNGGEIYIASSASYTHTNNSWDGGASITAADFKALPASMSAGITLLSSPRNSDGTLPDLGNYFKLADNSDALDAGVDVGLPYLGKAPDLGPFETSSVITTPTPPQYVNGVIENATPSRLEMTYNLTLANVVPAASAFAVRVNNTARTVSSVSVSGTKVYLNLASPVVYGDNVTVAYTKPASNPLQTTAGGQAATIGGQNVVNNCSVTPNQPPLVNISSPTKSNDFIAPALITIDAVANDPDGTIVKVEFFNGQTKLGESTSVPYSLVWKDVPAGSYIITASATDNMNAKTVSASVTVVVEKSTPAVNQSPTVTIKNPNKGEKYKKHDILILEAEASDPDGTITSVLFKNGDIIIAEVTESPYTYQWQIPDTGSFFITATAIDNLGALTESPGIDFSVFESEGSGFGIISLYPNPSDGSFSVNMSGSSEDERRFTVYNMSGQAVVNEQRPGQEVTLLFNLPELPSGTYILAISDKNKIVDSKTFIKK